MRLVPRGNNIRNRQRSRTVGYENRVQSTEDSEREREREKEIGEQRGIRYKRLDLNTPTDSSPDHNSSTSGANHRTESNPPSHPFPLVVVLTARKSRARLHGSLGNMHKHLLDRAPGGTDMQRRTGHVKQRGVLMRLVLSTLGRPVEIGLESDEDAGEFLEMRVFGPQSRDVRKGVWVGRVVRVDDDIALVEQLGLVLENSGFELAQLVEDQVALLAAGEFDRVDGCAWLDRGMVGCAEPAGQEGVEEGGFARVGGSQDMAQDHVAANTPWSSSSLAWTGHFEGCGGRRVAAV